MATARATATATATASARERRGWPGAARAAAVGFGVGLGAAVVPGAAHAEYNPGQYMVSPGVAFSVAFGRVVEVGVALDVRGTVLLDGRTQSCSTEPRGGVGVYVAVGWYHRSGWRFGAGAHGGREIGGQTFGLDGEVGWVYRLGRAELPSTHGLHLGLVGQLAPAGVAGMFGVGVPVGVDLALSTPAAGASAVAGVGVRAPTLFGLGETCAVGRPLRQHGGGGGLLLPSVRVGAPVAAARGLDDATRAALCAHWLESARGECASVPAFIALARDLAAVGAPRLLVARALDAARDELRHAALAGALASRFAGVALSPVLPEVPPAPPAESRAAALVRLAVESWSDGCLVEGVAAARASVEREAASGAARRALDAVVPDEERHARLAYDVIAFALAAGGSPVRDALAAAAAGDARTRAAATDALSPPARLTDAGADRRALAAHGHAAPPAATVATTAATVDAAHARLRHLLRAA